MAPVPAVSARRPSVPGATVGHNPEPDITNNNTNTNINPSSDPALELEAATRKPAHPPSTLDIDVELLHAHKSLASGSAGDRRKAVGRIVSRTAITALCTAAAVGIPDFGKVMAFLGSFSAFLICVILPVSQSGWSDQRGRGHGRGQGCGHGHGYETKHGIGNWYCSHRTASYRVASQCVTSQCVTSVC